MCLRSLPWRNEASDFTLTDHVSRFEPGAVWKMEGNVRYCQLQDLSEDTLRLLCGVDVQGCQDSKLQAERVAALQERKQALEALLSNRVGELKQVCLQEAVSIALVWLLKTYVNTLTPCSVQAERLFFSFIRFSLGFYLRIHKFQFSFICIAHYNQQSCPKCFKVSQLTEWIKL